MRKVDILLIGIGLAMDACAVSVCKGLAMKKLNWRKALVIATYFGFFQMLMPTIGYFLGYTFEGLVTKIDHWIAFVLLVLIGINMIRDIFENNEDEKNDRVDFKTMIVLAVATSIDALAVGITFAFLKTNILEAGIIIGITTFIISLIGVKLGNKFGLKYENKAKITGGIILILIGVKILIEHLGLV